MRFLVTAGPTREPLDPVRYLSNRSSGRMGHAVAAALRDAGHEVVLVRGPVASAPPDGVEVHDVETADEMLAACLEAWPRCDGVFGVAAVADYRPKRRSPDKLKRSGENAVLELVPNPDVLATLARDRGARLAVGFALESREGEAEARHKMLDKGLDVIALNGPEAQGAERARLLLLARDGRRQAVGPAPKEDLARALVAFALDRSSGEEVAS